MAPNLALGSEQPPEDEAPAVIGDPAAGAAKAAACAGCHGPAGHGNPPMFPSLAGQHEAYLAKQLTDMVGGARMEPMMAGVVAGMDAQTVADIAAHFAAAEPRPLLDGARDAKGEALYRFGNPAAEVPPCAGCHGTRGLGYPDVFPGGVPRLAGQPVEYTTKQLKAFKSGQRANDPGGVMQTLVARLSDEEITAIAKYVASF